MELWIRSQDKMLLSKTIDIRIVIEQEGASIIDDTTSYILGMYVSEERALEVLDEIQNILNPMMVFENCNCTKDMLDEIEKAGACMVSNNSHIEQLSTYVYEMPEK